MTGRRFFKTNENRPKTDEWVMEFEKDSIFRALLEPLSYVGPMRQAQDHNNPVGINRHDILHGTCFDYGDSKINGYKVLSLLNYIGDTVYEAKQYLDKRHDQNAKK
ncbi:MAG: hypothetical protein GX431_10145 [Bacteroidales bacterium]|nr:hypothetical protein [Bacteroidales bacterium]